MILIKVVNRAGWDGDLPGSGIGPGPADAVRLETLLVPDLFFDVQPYFPGGERKSIPDIPIIRIRDRISFLPGT